MTAGVPYGVAGLRIAVDATSLLGDRSGVGEVTGAILAGLAGRPDVTTTAFAVTLRGRAGWGKGRGRVGRGEGRGGDVVPTGIAVAGRPMAARPLRWCWARADRPPIEWWTGHVDVVHGPNFVVPPARRAARVVTVHDLTAWRYPELVTADTARYPLLVARAVAGGAWVHTPSRFVADEVVEVLGVSPERVVAVANGAVALGPEGPQSDAAAGRRRVGGGPYVLALGTVEPRKDLPRLVAAFDRAAPQHPELQLVIAGANGWGAEALTAAIDRSPHAARIVRLGRVDDRARAALVRGAHVFAYPSRYEGFGLPPLEAMEAGVPVLTTAAGALPEVVGDAAEVVAPDDTDALAEGLARLVTDGRRRDELIMAGHARRARFSWGAAIDALVELYARAAAAR